MDRKQHRKEDEPLPVKCHCLCDVTWSGLKLLVLDSSAPTRFSKGRVGAEVAKIHINTVQSFLFLWVKSTRSGFFMSRF